MKRVLLRIWIFLPLFVCACETFGPDKTAELERRIAQLEKNYLEMISDTNREQAPPEAPPGKPTIQNWRKLKLGMSTDAVVRILGEPEHIRKSSYSEDWEYPSGGRIDFFDGQVERWSEPW